MLRIITTFDDVLYRASGHRLLESIRAHLPHAQVLVYTELTQESISETSVPINILPEFASVADKNQDIIATADTALEPFNRRWFGWFRKVIAQHDALVRRPFDGYTVFLDADVRVIRSFPVALITQQLHRPVGVFRGDRESIESGVIFYDEKKIAAVDFVRSFMNLYLSGEFRRQRFWADNYIMQCCAESFPDAVQDLAQGRTAIKYRNSNGHSTSGQILPQTVWGDFLEHDKGLHWRQGLVTAPHQDTIAGDQRGSS